MKSNTGLLFFVNENKGFSLYKGKPRVYLDDFEVYCIADNGVFPWEIFEDKLVILPHEDFELWEGKDAFFVKPFHKKLAYSKGIVDEIFEIFEELGCYKDTFCFLPNRKILVVTSDGMWSADLSFMSIKFRVVVDAGKSPLESQPNAGH